MRHPSRVRLITLLQSINHISYTFKSFNQVQPSAEATETVCKALGGIQHTIFGATWEFTTVADHADTAYTNLPLAAHNDNIYWTEAAG